MKLGILAAHYTADLAALRLELEELRALGYECIDYQGFAETETELFSMSDEAFEKYLRDVKEILDGVGLSVSQTHGPWRYPPQDATEEDRAERFEKMSRALHGTAILGAPYMVLHNLMPFGREDEEGSEPFVLELNRDFFARLCDVAAGEGVTVCLENMPFPLQYMATPERTLAFVKSLGHPNLRVCLDVGHATRLGVSAGDAVRLLGKEYLRTLHVHDNDGTKDRHWMPYHGLTDWEDFSAALQEIGFEGTLSIETKLARDPSEEPLEVKKKQLFEAAKRIAGR